MLGKRTRSIHPSASNCSFMDRHFPPPAPTSPSPPPPIPQIIGFNPTHDRSDYPIRFNTFMPPDGLPFPADPSCPARRSSVFPRSALQTLLAAARQAAELTDGGSDSVMASPSLAGASRSGFVNQSENIQGSTANRVWTEANDTFLTDFEFSLASLEGKNSVRMSNFNPATPLSFNREHNGSMIGTSREARAKGLSESRHFLFLATSPLTSDVTTFSPMINFLDSCYLCKRPLENGLDIFMYRGDTAFCSAECRYQQILVDERKEKSSPSTLRSGSGSSSYTHGRNRRSQVMQPSGTAAAA